MIFSKLNAIKKALDKQWIECCSIYRKPECQKIFKVLKENVDDMPDFMKTVIDCDGYKVTLAFIGWEKVARGLFYYVYNAYVDFDEQLQNDIMEKRKVTIDKIREIIKVSYYLDEKNNGIFVYINSFFDRPNEIISLMLENDECYLLYDDGVKVCLNDCSWELIDKIYMSIEH